MNDQAFTDALGEVRNGTDGFHFNPLYRWMEYSDGVQEVAETGCYWLLDILGTELRVKLRALNIPYVMLNVSVVTKDGKAKITATTATTGDDVPPIYTKKIGYTDMPNCKWDMLLTYEDDKGRLILVTEY